MTDAAFVEACCQMWRAADKLDLLRGDRAASAWLAQRVSQLVDSGGDWTIDEVLQITDHLRARIRRAAGASR